jgi:ABC-2 type transport system permease protein
VTELRACVVKELRLLLRDMHGLALLFVMPVAFILVMSLALQDQFAARAGKKITVLFSDQDQGAAAADLITRLQATDAFALRAATATPIETQLGGDTHFALTIAKGFAEQPIAGGAAVTLEVAPDAAQQTQMIVAAAVREALGRQTVERTLQTLRATLPVSATANAPLLKVNFRYATGQAPSAVQQNVPAWLVFAIFFVVIPVSNSVIRERQAGTARRIRTTRVGAGTLLLGKLVPYFAVNQLQVVAMISVGMYLVPLLGGNALTLHGSIAALAVMAGAVSIAALGYALLIAVVAKSTEQATIIGGAGNIILAAVGGIMVPKFIMPAAMQRLADWSPLSWGLEGFLDVFLRGGRLQSVLAEAASLVVLGLAALALAGWLQTRARD